MNFEFRTSLSMFCGSEHLRQGKTGDGSPRQGTVVCLAYAKMVRGIAAFGYRGKGSV
jgi:hypothetical protein